MSTINQELLRQKYLEKFTIDKWLQHPIEEPQFLDAESSLILGAPHKGKSRLLMRLLLMFRLRNIKLGRKVRIFDVFGAWNDAESTNHLLNPLLKGKIAIIAGNEVEISGFDGKVIHIGDFTLDATKDYEVIITDRALFGPPESEKLDNRYYSALAKIFKKLQNRTDPDDLIVLAMREIANVVYSINKAGVTRDQQQAQEEFRVMHSQRYHSRIACVMDTQRFTDSLASVRSLADYVYLKGFGRQPIPSELTYLFKPHLFGHDKYTGWRNPRHYMVRNIKKNQFIVLPPSNGVGIGSFADIPWHIKKGFSPLRKLGITVSLKPQEDSRETAEKRQDSEWQEANYVPPNDDLHRKMIELKVEGGLSYQKIAEKFKELGIPMTWQKVQYHLQNKCACEITSR